MKNYSILLVAAVIVLSFHFGRTTVKKNTVQAIRDTVTVVCIDTVIKEKVIPQKVYIDRYVIDTLFSTDTVKVEVLVPISKYIFTDSLYRAEISGYDVSLESIEIYRQTVEKNIYVPYKERKYKRWGLGISVGYAITPKGFQPYFGVGIQYNLLNW